jgi:hypothetical protein
MLSEISRLAVTARNRSYRLIVIPAKAGIYRQHEAWIPAFAGMTFLGFFERPSSMNVFVFAG